MKAAGWKRWSQDASTSFNVIISRVKVYHWEQGCCRAVEGCDPCSIPDPTAYWALVSSHQDAETHTWFRMVPAPHEWKWLHQTEDYSLHFFAHIAWHCIQAKANSTLNVSKHSNISKPRCLLPKIISLTMFQLFWQKPM